MILFIKGGLRLLAIRIQFYIYTKIYKMDIDPSARISFGAKIDKTNPRGVHIARESYIASGAIVFAHDFSRGFHKDTYIGRRCFIGANAIIMCGVRIGDEVVIGSGAIVTKDIPNNCIVAGNPARILKQGIHTKPYGQIRVE